MKNFFNKMGIWILAAAVVIVVGLSILSATGTGLLDNIAGTIASPFRAARDHPCVPRQQLRVR